MALPAEDHPVIAHMLNIRKAMLQRDAALLNSLTREYLKAYGDLKSQIKALKNELAEKQPEKGDLMRLASLQNLLEGVKLEIGKFAHLLADKIEATTLAEIQQAGLDAFGLTQASLPGLDVASLAVGWSRISPEQVYTMFGFLDPQGPLYANIRKKFSQAVADVVRDTLLQGYIAGMHSTEIAALIAKATGAGLNWALNAARTATLWSYRAAMHLNYQRNSHVVRGWVWWSARDQRTCMSCIAKHGSVHSLSEILADHHMGRCTALPLTVSYADLGITGIQEKPLQIISGEEWFKNQPESMQKDMMGLAMWKAWKDGAITFDQLSVPYVDPVYGKMYREASLKGVLGDKAKLYYE